MNTSLVAQTESENFVIFGENNSYTAAKHVVACEKARKAYLRAIYGYQPRNGWKVGNIISAVADGSIVTVEIRFLIGFSSRVGMFELPLHVFKEDGKSLTSSVDIDDLVDRAIIMTVIDQYDFNGVRLSLVDNIALRGTYVYEALTHALSLTVPK